MIYYLRYNSIEIHNVLTPFIDDIDYRIFYGINSI